MSINQRHTSRKTTDEKTEESRQTDRQTRTDRDRKTKTLLYPYSAFTDTSYDNIVIIGNRLLCRFSLLALVSFIGYGYIVEVIVMSLYFNTWVCLSLPFSHFMLPIMLPIPHPSPFAKPCEASLYPLIYSKTEKDPLTILLYMS